MQLSFSNLIRLAPSEALLVEMFEIALFLLTTLGGLQGDLVDKSILATNCKEIGSVKKHSQPQNAQCLK